MGRGVHGGNGILAGEYDIAVSLQMQKQYTHTKVPKSMH